MKFQKICVVAALAEGTTELPPTELPSTELPPEETTCLTDELRYYFLDLDVPSWTSCSSDGPTQT